MLHKLYLRCKFSVKELTGIGTRCWYRQAVADRHTDVRASASFLQGKPQAIGVTVHFSPVQQAIWLKFKHLDMHRLALPPSQRLKTRVDLQRYVAADDLCNWWQPFWVLPDIAKTLENTRVRLGQ